MLGRYAYFNTSIYQDISVKGEYAPITNPGSIIYALPSTYFKNLVNLSNTAYPDVLSYNYTDIEFKYEPNKLSIDESTLNLFYMLPTVLYTPKGTSSSINSTNANMPTVYEKEDIILDINNIPHKDLLYELSDESIEYLIVPQSSDWNSLLTFLEHSGKAG